MCSLPSAMLVDGGSMDKNDHFCGLKELGERGGKNNP